MEKVYSIQTKLQVHFANCMSIFYYSIHSAQTSKTFMSGHHQWENYGSVHSVHTKTYTSFFAILFKSIPYSLAPMKCSLNAGISLMVAMQPSTDMQQLITKGITGTGDIFYFKGTEVNSSVLVIRNCVGQQVNED